MDNLNDSSLAKIECCTISSTRQIRRDEFQSLVGFGAYFTGISEPNRENISFIDLDRLRDFMTPFNNDEHQIQLTKCLKLLYKEIQEILTSDSELPMFLDVIAIMTDLIVLNKPPLRLFDLKYMDQDCKMALLKHWARFDNSMFTVMVDNIRTLLLQELIENIDSPVQYNVAEYFKLLYYSNLYGGERHDVCTLDSKYIMDNDNFFFDLDFSDIVFDTIVAECKYPKIPLEKFLILETTELLPLYVSVHTILNNNYTAYLKLPFIFSLDYRIQALKEINSNIRAIALETPLGQHNRVFLLQVRRDLIENDALKQLMLEIKFGFHRARLPIRLKFHDEIGSDIGGLSREFFRIMTERMFDSRMPLFAAKEGGFYWLKRNHERLDIAYLGFKLFGVLLGLALYNGILVNVRFPNVFYRKLLGLRGTLSDLHDFDPHLASSLMEILNYENDDFEDILMLNFVASVDNGDGTSSTLTLLEGGENIAVTQANKREYVRRYVDLILNESVNEEFTQFKCGFGSTVSLDVLKLLFRPEELGEAMSGADHVNVDSLENVVDYDEGYDPSSPTVRLFWEVVREMSESELRALLIFVTASDHVPLDGAPAIVICDGGADIDLLPWSNTCFNRLNLPRYSSKTKLKEKLLKAIAYNEGFGFV